MQLLAEKVGKARVIEIIRETAGMDITFRQYPHDDSFLLRLRERLNTDFTFCLSLIFWRGELVQHNDG